MPNTPQWIICWLSIQKNRGNSTYSSNLYTRDLTYIAGDSGAEPSYAQTQTLAMPKKELKEDGALDTVIVTRMADLYLVISGLSVKGSTGYQKAK